MTLAGAVRFLSEAATRTRKSHCSRIKSVYDGAGAGPEDQIEALAQRLFSESFDFFEDTQRVKTFWHRRRRARGYERVHLGVLLFLDRWQSFRPVPCPRPISPLRSGCLPPASCGPKLRLLRVIGILPGRLGMAKRSEQPPTFNLPTFNFLAQHLDQERATAGAGRQERRYRTRGLRVGARGCVCGAWINPAISVALRVCKSKVGYVPSRLRSRPITSLPLSPLAYRGALSIES